MTVSDRAVPRVVRLLADPVRWRLACELARGDHRVRELVAATGHPQNLVSYHLRQLRDGGLVTARRSSFDARDTYYRLNLDGCAEALAGAANSLHPGLAPLAGRAALADLGMAPSPATESVPGTRSGSRTQPGPGPGHRVLSLGTGKSTRSPMAEALLRHRAGQRVLTMSAGIRPKPVHQTAVAVLRDRYRIDLSGHRATHVETVVGQRFDYVISLCDRAREACPEFEGRPERVHWSLPDPAAGEDGLAGLAAFERTAADLDTRIRFLLPALESIKTA
jgi:ArsR family transcriptional regulator, arsenate/arsenite/antimonite-responsive transcriptional repressor / arsenate reductase (thioredoxin)